MLIYTLDSFELNYIRATVPKINPAHDPRQGLTTERPSVLYRVPSVSVPHLSASVLLNESLTLLVSSEVLPEQVFPS